MSEEKLSLEVVAPEKMDKDRFRFNLGSVEEKYQEVYNLICTP